MAATNMAGTVVDATETTGEAAVLDCSALRKRRRLYEKTAAGSLAATVFTSTSGSTTNAAETEAAAHVADSEALELAAPAAAAGAAAPRRVSPSLELESPWGHAGMQPESVVAERILVLALSDSDSQAVSHSYESVADTAPPSPSPPLSPAPTELFNPRMVTGLALSSAAANQIGGHAKHMMPPHTRYARSQYDSDGLLLEDFDESDDSEENLFGSPGGGGEGGGGRNGRDGRGGGGGSAAATRVGLWQLGRGGAGGGGGGGAARDLSLEEPATEVTIAYRGHQHPSVNHRRTNNGGEIQVLLY
jgi:hypothetical protein